LKIFSDCTDQDIGKKKANGGAEKQLGFTMPRLEPSRDRQRQFLCPGSLRPDERVGSNAPRDITSLLF